MRFPQFLMKMAHFGVSSWSGVGDTTLGGEVMPLVAFMSDWSSGWVVAAKMSFRVWLITGVVEGRWIVVAL